MFKKLTIALVAILIIGVSSAYATGYAGTWEGDVYYLFHHVVFNNGTWEGTLVEGGGLHDFQGSWVVPVYNHQTHQWVNVTGWIYADINESDLAEGYWGYEGNSNPAGEWNGDFAVHCSGTWTDSAGGDGGTWSGSEQ